MVGRRPSLTRQEEQEIEESTGDLAWLALVKGEDDLGGLRPEDDGEGLARELHVEQLADDGAPTTSGEARKGPAAAKPCRLLQHRQPDGGHGDTVVEEEKYGRGWRRS